MFFLRKNLLKSCLLQHFTDYHSHLLYGVDDGVSTLEQSLSILSNMESAGYSNLWLTPHIMEDIPNTTEKLQQRFDELCKSYKGNICLHLASEYMLDALYMKRFEKDDLLLLKDKYLLVETSYFNPPYNMDDMLKETIRKGYWPVLAHPERYTYMEMDEYRKYKDMNILFQLNIPSLAGAYGKMVQKKAEQLLDNGFYNICGFDTHSSTFFNNVIRKKFLTSSKVKQLENLINHEI
jgi:protein-tyrosine phosphatase